MIDKKIYNLGKKLFKINRSITGAGTRLTLKYIKKELKNLKILKINSGKNVYDWTVPQEWNVNYAYVKDKFDNKIIDLKKNNLHLVGYSTPKSSYITKKKLLSHLHSIKNQPNAIPYITSYYKKYWGFCVTHIERKKIEKKYNKNDKFFIEINSSFKKKGCLSYGELIIPGESKQEILISTYVCHPQMANNELSGPLVATSLAKYFLKKKNKKTLRFIFVPETIGSIAYIHKNISKIKENVIGGYVLSCIGDERSYSYLPTKYGNTIADRAAKKAFKELSIKYKTFSFLDRGSDERQFNSPGVDWPIASILRTKYDEYPEYHTSLDDFNLVTRKGLGGGFNVVKKAIEIIMQEIIPKSKTICEPKLQKRKLYESLSVKENYKKNILSSKILDFLQYSDNKNNILDISKHIKCSVKQTYDIHRLLLKNNLLKID
jgi:aminopeptidase-like protein